MTGGPRIAERSALQVAGRALSLVMAAVAFGLVARMLDVDEFGSYATAVAIFSIASTLAEFGLQQTTVLEMSESGHVGDALRSALLASLSLGVVAVVVGMVVAVLLPINAAAALICMVPAFVVTRVTIPFLALRQFEIQLRRVALADVLGSTAAGAVLLGVTLVGAPEGSNARFAVIGVAMLASSLVALAVAVQRPPAATLPRASHVRRAWTLARRSLPLGLTNATSYLHVRLDQIFLAVFGLTVALAGYAIAYRFVDAGLALVGGIGTVAFPLLSRAAGRDERSRIAQDVSSLLVLAGVSLSLASFYLAPLLVRLLAGPGYDDAVWLLRLLSPALLVSVMSLAPSQIAIVERQAASLLKISVVAVVVNAGLNALLIPHIGVEGSIIATIVTELGGLIAMSVIARAYVRGIADVRTFVLVGVGYAVASFIALLLWQTVNQAAAGAVALVGIAIALAPVSRPALDLVKQFRVVAPAPGHHDERAGPSADE